MEEYMEYELNQFSRITDPGKFEGEPYYVPFYWNLVLEGVADEEEGGDEGEDYIATFNLGKEDWERFPELQGRKTLCLTETSDGFVQEI